MHEFGVLDAASYEEGVVRRHLCGPVPVALLNEPEWLSLADGAPEVEGDTASSAAPLEPDIVEEARQQLLAKQWLL